MIGSSAAAYLLGISSSSYDSGRSAVSRLLGFSSSSYRSGSSAAICCYFVFAFVCESTINRPSFFVVI
jgi:hypothetical protein